MEKLLFLEYPKCSTCQKAKKWLDDHGIIYEARHIVEQNPTVAELRQWHQKSGLPLKSFFNTSGLVYKAQNLKERLPNLSDEEQYEVLAGNGMLVKRPLLVASDFVLAGFKPDLWQQKLRR